MLWTIYCFVGIACSVALLGFGLYDDWRIATKRKPRPRGKYVPAHREIVMWVLVVVIAIPVLNLFALALAAFIAFEYWSATSAK